LGNRKERVHWGDVGLDGRIILEWVSGERAVYMFLVRKAEGKRPLGRRRRRCVDNIRLGFWGEVLYKFLVGKPEGKSRLGRPRRRWVDNIRMDL
jgi:hypothetical protein